MSIFNKTDNWKSNLNYWTGAQSCSKAWGWCSESQFLSLNQNLKWGPNQPDNKMGEENCIHLRIFQNDTGAVLTDRDCKNKFIFACKVIVYISLNSFYDQFYRMKLFRCHLHHRQYALRT
jgi:hypothetical protein